MARTPLEHAVRAEVNYITLNQDLKWIHAHLHDGNETLGLPPVSDIARFVEWRGGKLCASTSYGEHRLRTFTFDPHLRVWQDDDPDTLAFSYIEVPPLVVDAFRKTYDRPPRCVTTRAVNPPSRASRPKAKTVVAQSDTSSFLSKFAAQLGIKPHAAAVAGRVHSERKK